MITSSCLLTQHIVAIVRGCNHHHQTDSRVERKVISWELQVFSHTVQNCLGKVYVCLYLSIFSGTKCRKYSHSFQLSFGRFYMI